MNGDDLMYRDVSFSIEASILSVTFTSDFGAISVSLNLDLLQEQVSKVISDLFNTCKDEDQTALLTIARDYGVSPDEVRKNLEEAILYNKRGQTRTAVDKFLRGKNLHTQGLVEQLIDNLPAGVVLLLLHMTIAAIAHSVPDVPITRNQKQYPPENELLQMMNPQFRKSIVRLWERR
jgi:hypothetical protein